MERQEYEALLPEWSQLCVSVSDRDIGLIDKWQKSHPGFIEFHRQSGKEESEKMRAQGLQPVGLGPYGKTIWGRI